MTLSLLKTRCCGRCCAVLLTPHADGRDLTNLLSPRFALDCEGLLLPPRFDAYTASGRVHREIDLAFAAGTYLYVCLGAEQHETPLFSSRMRGERLSLILHESLPGAPLFDRPVPLGARILPFDLLTLDSPYAVSFFHALPLSRVPLADWGTRVSQFGGFPLRTRAVFCEASDGALALRVWDCEVGELPSSVTAATAALHLSLLRGILRVHECITVRMRGGAMTLRACRVLGETHIDTESRVCFEARVEI